MLQKLCSKKCYIQQFCSDKFDTSTILFEQVRYSKREFEQVSILQKVNSFIALGYIIHADLYGSIGTISIIMDDRNLSYTHVLRITLYYNLK